MKKWYVFDNRRTKAAAPHIDKLKAQSKSDAVDEGIDEFYVGYAETDDDGDVDLNTIVDTVDILNRYHIDYNTCAGDDYAQTLDEAKAIADRYASYTQQDIVITDWDGKEIARRRWYGVSVDEDLYSDEDLDDLIRFGAYGYYDFWD